MWLMNRLKSGKVISEGSSVCIRYRMYPQKESEKSMLISSKNLTNPSESIISCWESLERVL